MNWCEKIALLASVEPMVVDRIRAYYYYMHILLLAMPCSLCHDVLQLCRGIHTGQLAKLLGHYLADTVAKSKLLSYIDAYQQYLHVCTCEQGFWCVCVGRRSSFFLATYFLSRNSNLMEEKSHDVLGSNVLDQVTSCVSMNKFVFSPSFPQAQRSKFRLFENHSLHRYWHCILYSFVFVQIDGWIFRSLLDDI